MKQRRAMTLSGALELIAPHTWPAAILPTVLGVAISYADGYAVKPWFFLLTLGVAVLLQSAVNTLNDWVDFASGLDTAENCTDSTDASLVYGKCTAKGALVFGLLLCVAAAFCGGVLTAFCGWQMLLYGAAAAAAIALYVIPVISFSGLPFGELLSGFAMGGVLTCASIQAQTGRITGTDVLQCLPSVITIGCILLGNNISDIEKDSLNHRHTLCVLAGRRASRCMMYVALGTAEVLTIVLVAVLHSHGLPVLAAGIVYLAVTPQVRHFLASPMDAGCRKSTMAGVLACHSGIIACYSLAVFFAVAA